MIYKECKFCCTNSELVVLDDEGYCQICGSDSIISLDNDVNNIKGKRAIGTVIKGIHSNGRELTDQINKSEDNTILLINKLFTKLGSLEGELNYLRASSGTTGEVRDVSELPNWAVNYIEKLHELIGPVHNCPVCGDVFTDYCCGGIDWQGDEHDAVEPIVADPFIYDN